MNTQEVEDALRKLRVHRGFLEGWITAHPRSSWIIALVAEIATIAVMWG